MILCATSTTHFVILTLLTGYYLYYYGRVQEIDFGAHLFNADQTKTPGVLITRVSPHPSTPNPAAAPIPILADPASLPLIPFIRVDLLFIIYYTQHGIGRGILQGQGQGYGQDLGQYQGYCLGLGPVRVSVRDRVKGLSQGQGYIYIYIYISYYYH